MPDVSALTTRWRERAQLLRTQAAAESAACAYEVAAAELEAALHAGEEEFVPLERAAQISGYSAGHLARLVRSGRIPDRRDRGSRARILIRAADLPKRAGPAHVADADVHELASRLYGGKEARHGHP